MDAATPNVTQVNADIAVIGSLNRDVTVRTPRHPGPGETVLGTGHYWDYGGKGANQAVAAARLGAGVAMVGRVGDDDDGRALTANLRAEGIDVSGIEIDPDAPTGLAVITIDASAENTIVVSAGANAKVSSRQVRRRTDAIGSARVLLAQLEVPVEAVSVAAKVASGLVCLNPAPAADLPPALLSRVDVLIPNSTELARLVGTTPPSTPEEVAHAAARLDTDAALVVTLGGDGAVIVEAGQVEHVSAPRVEAIDPTGAGDAFCGALAGSLSRGESLGAAVRRAVAAGALATTRPGAQGAMPTAEELERALSG
jgi:ribokinase